ncbi:unnamed protein product [Tetraodon nigroviridis]|uniref:(spotted green pufferfish) hypothetical protein n=1 Tax=Tetraodon nigroviridis TaxID=99883 RepID=Q4RQU1_TETNG|nr:unnamed protein product [Tetraodon nigroviridis]
MLLTFLVLCTIAFVVHLIISHPLFAEMTNNDVRHHLSWMITLLIMHSSMTGAVSMSFYYYVQIVPSQRALLIWIKRNIKSFIYVIFLFGEIFLAFSSFVNVLSVVLDSWVVSANNCTNNELPVVGPTATDTVVSIFVRIHILCCMAIMGVCNFSMTHYLLRHIKSRTRQGFAASETQMRVAISDLIQAVFFLICGRNAQTTPEASPLDHGLLQPVFPGDAPGSVPLCQ